MYKQEVKWSKDARKLRALLKAEPLSFTCILILQGGDVSQVTDTGYDDWNNGELGLNLNYSGDNWLYDLDSIDAWCVLGTDEIVANI